MGGKVTEWPHSKYIITDFNDFSGDYMLDYKKGEKSMLMTSSF